MERNRDLIDGNANRRNSLRSTLGEEADALFHRAHAHTSIESSVRGTRVPIRYSSFDRVEALPRDVENAALQIPPSPPVKLDGTRGACSTSRISPPPTPSITAGSSSRRRLGRCHGCFQGLGRRWINVAKRFQDIALHGCVNNGDLSKGFELSKAAPGRHLPQRDEAAQQLSKIPHPTCLNIERHIPNHPGTTRGWCFSPRAAEETLDGRGRGAERKDKG